MFFEEKMLGCPVDAIVETEQHIVIGSYCYENGARRGKVQYMNKNSLEVESEFETSGTLCLGTKDGVVYSANTSKITAFLNSGEIYSKETSQMNTYVSCGRFLVVSSIDGTITIMDWHLEPIKTIQLSTDPVWVAKQVGGRIYAGTEGGDAFSIDTKSFQVTKIGPKRAGILDFIEVGNNLYVSSYDDNIEVYSVDTLEHLKSIVGTGSLWKMVVDGARILCASMYDGLKIFSVDFELRKRIPTESICYGICVVDRRVFWSSFYENKIFWVEIDELFKEGI